MRRAVIFALTFALAADAALALTAPPIEAVQKFQDEQLSLPMSTGFQFFRKVGKDLLKGRLIVSFDANGVVTGSLIYERPLHKPGYRNASVTGTATNMARVSQTQFVATLSLRTSRGDVLNGNFSRAMASADRAYGWTTFQGRNSHGLFFRKRGFRLRQFGGVFIN